MAPFGALLLGLVVATGLLAACTATPPTPTSQFAVDPAILDALRGTPTSQLAVDPTVVAALRATLALAPPAVSAEALHAEFEADPATARIRYVQSTLTVTGVVESVGWEAGHPLLTLATAGKWGVQCFPSDDSEEAPNAELVGRRSRYRALTCTGPGTSLYRTAMWRRCS